MLVELDQMPGHARLWIYQISRPLAEQEHDFVSRYTQKFLSQWQAHGQDLRAGFSIEHNQFLIISVDESFSQASGCSIDSSVHLIQALENELGVSFMTTSQVAFFMEDKISLIPFNSIKEQVSNQVITPDTHVFDNTVKNLAEFREKWRVPSRQTWISRYFK